MAQETTTTQAIDEESSDARGRFDRAKEAVASASEKVKEKVATAGESVKKSYASASEKAKARYGEVREKVGEMEIEESIETARDWVRKNPGKAVLISVGIGFLIGLVLRRDDD